MQEVPHLTSVASLFELTITDVKNGQVDCKTNKKWDLQSFEGQSS